MSGEISRENTALYERLKSDCVEKSSKIGFFDNIEAKFIFVRGEFEEGKIGDDFEN
jgi:hypothetical protein